MKKEKKIDDRLVALKGDLETLREKNRQLKDKNEELTASREWLSSEIAKRDHTIAALRYDVARAKAQAENAEKCLRSVTNATNGLLAYYEKLERENDRRNPDPAADYALAVPGAKPHWTPVWTEERE